MAETRYTFDYVLRDRDRKPNTVDLATMKQEISRFNEIFNERGYRTSLSAALIITAPLQLLNIALGSLLTGFGIYFGFVYSVNLPTIGGHHSALAVLGQRSIGPRPLLSASPHQAFRYDARSERRC